MKKKKRQNSQAATTTVHVVADIDYDKLAAAIVKAQQSPKQEKSDDRMTNKSLVKKIWAILRGKKDTDGHFVVSLFSLLVILFLRAISFLGILFLLGTVFFIIISISNMSWELQYLYNNISSIVMIIVFGVFILLITAIVHVAAGEIEKTEDRNLVFAVFSSLTSLVALIVALIALKN